MLRRPSDLRPMSESRQMSDSRLRSAAYQSMQESVISLWNVSEISEGNSPQLQAGFHRPAFPAAGLLGDGAQSVSPDHSVHQLMQTHTSSRRSLRPPPPDAPGAAAQPLHQQQLHHAACSAPPAAHSLNAGGDSPGDGALPRFASSWTVSAAALAGTEPSVVALRTLTPPGPDGSLESSGVQRWPTQPADTGTAPADGSGGAADRGAPRHGDPAAAGGLPEEAGSPAGSFEKLLSLYRRRLVHAPSVDSPSGQHVLSYRALSGELERDLDALRIGARSREHRAKCREMQARASAALGMLDSCAQAVRSARLGQLGAAAVAPMATTSPTLQEAEAAARRSRRAAAEREQGRWREAAQPAACAPPPRSSFASPPRDSIEKRGSVTFAAAETPPQESVQRLPSQSAPQTVARRHSLAQDSQGPPPLEVPAPASVRTRACEAELTPSSPARSSPSDAGERPGGAGGEEEPAQEAPPTAALPARTPTGLSGADAPDGSGSPSPAAQVAPPTLPPAPNAAERGGGQQSDTALRAPPDPRCRVCGREGHGAVARSLSSALASLASRDAELTELRLAAAAAESALTEARHSGEHAAARAHSLECERDACLGELAEARRVLSEALSPPPAEHAASQLPAATTRGTLQLEEAQRGRAAAERRLRDGEALWGAELARLQKELAAARELQHARDHELRTEMRAAAEERARADRLAAEVERAHQQLCKAASDGGILDRLERERDRWRRRERELLQQVADAEHDTAVHRRHTDEAAATADELRRLAEEERRAAAAARRDADAMAAERLALSDELADALRQLATTMRHDGEADGRVQAAEEAAAQLREETEQLRQALAAGPRAEPGEKPQRSPSTPQLSPQRSAASAAAWLDREPRGRQRGVAGRRGSVTPQVSTGHLSVGESMREQGHGGVEPPAAAAAALQEAEQQVQRLQGRCSALERELGEVRAEQAAAADDRARREGSRPLHSPAVPAFTLPGSGAEPAAEAGQARCAELERLLHEARARIAALEAHRGVHGAATDGQTVMDCDITELTVTPQPSPAAATTPAERAARLRGRRASVGISAGEVTPPHAEQKVRQGSGAPSTAERPVPPESPQQDGDHCMITMTSFHPGTPDSSDSGRAQQLAEAQQRIEALTQELKEAKAALQQERLMRTVTDGHATDAELQGRLTEVESQCTVIEKERDRLKETLRDQTSQMGDLSQRAHHAEQDAEESAAANDRLEAQVQALKKQLDAARAGSSAAELAELRTQVERYRDAAASAFEAEEQIAGLKEEAAAAAAAAKEERAARVAAAERLCAAESAAGSGHSPISADTVPAQPSRRSSRGKASELWRQCEELRASVAALQQRERELLLQVEQERQRADAAENRSVADPGSPDFSSAAGSQYGAERLRLIVTEREDDLHRARAEFEHISAEAERYKAKAESYKAEAAQYRAEAERAQEAGADTEPPRSVAPSDSQVRGAGSSAAGDREAQEAAHRAELEAAHSQLSELQAKAQADAQDLAAKAAELEQVRGELEQARQEIGRLQQQLAAAEERAAGQQGQQSDDAAQGDRVASLEKELAEYMELAEQLEGENAGLTAQLAEVKTQKAKLEEELSLSLDLIAELEGAQS
eukprot:TRINITY_DN5121_c0_g1_i4.p1 TRINITY_DN5121_c0_g1~~TRINITY_DN5121_c0_g1_i4.p1  ORF type:complete len:1619 (+),score=583.88 TRINITY_DN5121_c0_g1_i4:99-4955(+)